MRASAAWYLRALTDGVLGIEARLQGLCVKADLPPNWNQFRIRRPYRGAVYDITVRRVNTGEAVGCWVNGTAWEGEFLPIAPAGTVQKVEIVR